MELKRSSIAPDDNCTFTPDISISQEFGLNKSFQSKPFNQTTRNFLKAFKTRNYELETQASYRPAIGRPPKNRAKSKTETIGDYLYRLRVGSVKPDGSFVEESRMGTKEREKSAKLLRSAKDRCFRAIFKAIDADEDGVIKARNISLLPKEIADLYKPLMSEMGNEVSLEEYMKMSHSIFEESAHTSTLFSFYQALKKRLRTFPFNEFSFKPCITKNSKKICEKRGAIRADRYSSTQDIARAKLRLLKEEKLQKEMTECTFHPKLTPVKKELNKAFQKSETASAR
eukprot:TRINITY_DN4321_c0_g1_i8.p1 TRINITY_DN4321_c0_g1~~TRINITY_DN4321_c0_g1_i8.p1  ORF type:complete len:285 (-),score=52.90 TRINITY_DN4321_c0_g1_i8:73-927(-)